MRDRQRCRQQAITWHYHRLTEDLAVERGYAFTSLAGIPSTSAIGGDRPHPAPVHAVSLTDFQVLQWTPHAGSVVVHLVLNGGTFRFTPAQKPRFVVADSRILEVSTHLTGTF